jgi:hypothetical protein
MPEGLRIKGNDEIHRWSIVSGELCPAFARQPAGGYTRALKRNQSQSIRILSNF